MKVSVCITTFNKQDYISQALDSIIAQKTNFDFEILIYDDASTDGTVSIIKEYQKKDARIILLANSQNEYGNGIYGVNERNLFPIAKGTYIALCDGDDYWTDPFKLQKQIDFLDQNTEYILCCHDGEVYYQKSAEFGKVYKKSPDNPITFKDVISMGGNLCPTSSIVFRNSIKTYPGYIFKSMSNDRALTYFLITKGKFWFMKEKMCVYRVHDKGLIAAGNTNTRLKYLKSNVNLLIEYQDAVSNDKCQSKSVDKELSNTVKNIYYFDSFSGNKQYIKHIFFTDLMKVLVYKTLQLINLK